MKLLDSNSLAETGPHFLYLKMLLLGVGICVGYLLSQDRVGKKEIEESNWSNRIQLST
jgi:hypothetical protein